MPERIHRADDAADDAGGPDGDVLSPSGWNVALRYLFFLLIVRPIALIVIGLNVRRRALLPTRGPAIVVANHNSHLDAIVLMTLFGMRGLRHVHPVAAADYFLKNRALAWFATQIIGILPLRRDVAGMRTDPLAQISAALAEGRILILFPEGTRGEPEELSPFKTGVAHIAKRHPDVPVVPVFLAGLGKALPRGEAILVPFFCDVFVGEPCFWSGRRDAFMTELGDRLNALAKEAAPPVWE